MFLFEREKRINVLKIIVCIGVDICKLNGFVYDLSCCNICVFCLVFGWVWVKD